MKDCFGDEALQKQLIACCAIGWRLTEEETETWPQLRAARGETDTGAIIAFNTEAEDVADSLMIPAGMKTLSINPLNWKTDGELAEKKEPWRVLYRLWRQYPGRNLEKNVQDRILAYVNV